ncbi:DUF6542 domain-containing protein [Actinokineospora iranica]|uniref:DUF6542 domain-containing protein n=1 Tax=Actinokineospora iranica TaxID=1271860 RepID=A0A1G6RA56_9PSEU|nr:DUF6542 domain-containing protein [Actinokineospora iranica]SDD01313.1 hypothetical protein SAMN05216174_106232 [Actinokineospora iranica]
MTATHDRPSELDDDRPEPAWDERPIFGKSRGLPWWGAVALAVGVTAVAAVIDMQRQETLGKVFQFAYIVSCLAAVCLVRRRNLFGPMVQPPLVFAGTAISAILLFGPSGQGGGLKQLLFTVALPLTTNFPTMGITTGIVLAIGVGRLFTQRDPDAVDGASPLRKRPAEDRRPVDRKPRPTPDRNRPRPPRERKDPGRPRDDRAPERRPRDPARKPPPRRPRPD